MGRARRRVPLRQPRGSRTSGASAASEQTSNAVFAFEVDSGRQAWIHEGQGIDHDGIAVGGGARSSFVDRAADGSRAQRGRCANTIKDASVPDRKPDDGKGRRFDPDLRKIVALDAQTGKAVWEKPFNCTDITLDDNVIAEGRVGVACMYKDGVLVVHGTGSLGHPHKEFLAGQFARRALYAFDAADRQTALGRAQGLHEAADHRRRAASMLSLSPGN